MDDLAFIGQSAARLFSDLCTPESLRDVEEGAPPTDLWTATAETGLPWASLPEEAGGGGGTMLGMWTILRAAGWHGAPIPISEAGVIAGSLLGGSGQQLTYEPTTSSWPGNNNDVVLRRRDAGWSISGTLLGVPWARFCEEVVVLLEAEGRTVVARIPIASTSLTPRANIAGEWRDDVALESLTLADEAVADSSITRVELASISAMARSALMAGALERISAMTINYAKEREQFGRSIARFQAVQHQLVQIAEEASAASLASQAAAVALEQGPQRAAVAAATAKIAANDAVDSVTARAHQVHGAIGMTKEYPLHFATRRLWAWQEECGSSRYWRRRLGGLAADEGADGLWALITS